MRGKIGNKPKLAAVEAEVVTHVKDTPNLGTALRLAGPSCSSGYRKPDVHFAEDNGDNFENALEHAKPSGNLDFARALSQAVNDLIGPQKAASGKSKSVYLFVGGRDTCSSRPVEVVKQALHDLRPYKDVELTLKFVGIKVPPEVREILRATRKEAKKLGYDAAVVYANKPSDLDDVFPEGGGRPSRDQYNKSD